MSMKLAFMFLVLSLVLAFMVETGAALDMVKRAAAPQDGGDDDEQSRLSLAAIESLLG
uniref:Venom antimicrobial-like peptide Ld7a n=1 Tax=Lethocerus distinctifemur TaxID=280095 RepID=A0A2K8JLI0_9HEMI|nr:venom antimicrobial-like peptide Ld7a [Lethocerus distinctifemur]